MSNIIRFYQKEILAFLGCLFVVGVIVWTTLLCILYRFYSKQGFIYLYHPPKYAKYGKPYYTFKSKMVALFWKSKLNPLYMFDENLKKIYIKREVYGYYYYCYKATTTIIYFHGNATNFTEILFGIKTLSEKLDVNVLVIEYPGYGERTGKLPSRCVILNDLKRNLESIKNKLKSKNIILYGNSIGASVALHAATLLNDCKGIILQNPFLSLYSMLSIYKVPYWFKWLFYPENWDNGKIIKTQLDEMIPILMLCAEDDEIIPIEQKEKLYSLCKNVEMIKYEGLHNQSLSIHEFKRVKQWLSLT